MKFVDDIGLDSLDLVEFVMVLEDHFEIEVCSFLNYPRNCSHLRPCKYYEEKNPVFCKPNYLDCKVKQFQITDDEADNVHTLQDALDVLFVKIGPED